MIASGLISRHSFSNNIVASGALLGCVATSSSEYQVVRITEDMVSVFVLTACPKGSSGLMYVLIMLLCVDL